MHIYKNNNNDRITSNYINKIEIDNIDINIYNDSISDELSSCDNNGSGKLREILLAASSFISLILSLQFALSLALHRIILHKTMPEYYFAWRRLRIS